MNSDADNFALMDTPAWGNRPQADDYYDSDDRAVDLESEYDCNTCGQSDYMCPGH
jgi:hypothetical protein